MAELSDIQECCRDKRVALVCNSERISWRRDGQEIDEHDVVIRIGNARNMVRPDCAGQKTTMWVGATKNRTVQAHGLTTFKDTQYNIWTWPDSTYMYDELREKTACFTQDEYDIMGNRMESRPSTGALLVGWFALGVAYKELNIYGMDFYADGLRKDSPHRPKEEARVVRAFLEEHENIRLVEYPDDIRTDYPRDGLKVIIWPYRFTSMGDGWHDQMAWVCKALQARGCILYQHPKFGTKIQGSVHYEPGQEMDVAIYNHCLGRDIAGLADKAKAKRVWYFKPTIPDENHTTLDELGYGAYMTCTYQEPEFRDIPMKDVDDFYAKSVSRWVSARATKWGNWDATDVPDDDYYLVLGQIPTDTVVTTMSFGKYNQSLFSLVDELNRIVDRRIIVKLHPRLALKAECKDATRVLKASLAELGVRVSVEDRIVSVHSYFPKARCVLTCNSEAGIEAMFHDKPVIAWGYPQYHWVSYDLRHLCDLRTALDLQWYNRDDARRWVYWYLKRFTFWDLRSAQRRVDDLLGVNDAQT